MMLKIMKCKYKSENVIARKKGRICKIAINYNVERH